MRKGIKKIAIVVMAIALMLGTLALVTGCDKTPDLTLQQRIAQAGQQVQQLQNGSDVPTLSQIDALLKQLEALRAEVKRLEGAESDLLTQIDKYEGQLNDLRITNIKAQIAALEKQIAALEHGNTELQAKLDALREELENMKGLRLCENLEARIKQDYLQEFGRPFHFDRFLGIHNDIAVFFLASDDTGMGETTLAGVTFVHTGVASVFLAWSDGNFYTLSEAYDAGILDHSDIVRISTIHNEANDALAQE